LPGRRLGLLSQRRGDGENVSAQAAGVRSLKPLAAAAELGVHQQNAAVVPHVDDHRRIDTGPLGDALDGEAVDAPG